MLESERLPMSDAEREGQECSGNRGHRRFGMSRSSWPMRFTIRDLLWLTVVVALGVAWWIDRSRQEDRFQRERQAHQKLADWVKAGQWGKVGGDLFLEPPPLSIPSAP